MRVGERSRVYPPPEKPFGFFDLPTECPGEIEDTHKVEVKPIRSPPGASNPVTSETFLHQVETAFAPLPLVRKRRMLVAEPCATWEGAMKNIAFAVALTISAAAAALPQTSVAQGRSLPTFEVDKNWPKVPAGMKIGDVSSVAIDAQGNAWLLSRPRTLKGDDKAHAAPPITIFDPNGNYIRGWGGDGQGYQWPEREH